MSVRFYGLAKFATNYTQYNFLIYSTCMLQSVSSQILPCTSIQSGHVRSECLTCTYRGRCCSACLSRAQVLALSVTLSGTGKSIQ